MIDPQGNQLGILGKAEALEKALEFELDLVEIAPNTDPPVAKIIDFKKLRYEENKKDHAAKRSSGSNLKELWLSPRIADHDLGVRLARADEFLKDGDKVKLTVRFKGREMAHPEIGHQVLQKALSHFGDTIGIERESKFEGRNLSVIISKGKGGNKNEQNENEKSSAEKNQNN